MTNIEEKLKYDAMVQDANLNPEVLCLLAAKKMPTPASRLAVALADKMKPWRIKAESVRDLDDAFRERDTENLNKYLYSANPLVAGVAKVMLAAIQDEKDFTSGKVLEHKQPWWF